MYLEGSATAGGVDPIDAICRAWKDALDVLAMRRRGLAAIPNLPIALIIAGVVFVLIAVVAGLLPMVHITITARGYHAGTQTSVRIHIIAIIAGFRRAELMNAIATMAGLASVGAGITVHRITVVTSLPMTCDAIAAARFDGHPVARRRRAVAHNADGSDRTGLTILAGLGVGNSVIAR
jgi:hypothetical protein